MRNVPEKFRTVLGVGIDFPGNTKQSATNCPSSET
jgi:hypothetical protein